MTPPQDRQPSLISIPLRSWLAVFGAFLALFCTVGFLNAYGVFQAYYQVHQLADRSASEIAWIGSVSVFLLYLGAGFAGPLVDRFGPTRLLCMGGVGLLVAVFATSLCETYWQLILAQGVLLGAAMSLVFCTPLGVIMRHMPHHRGLAVGLAIGGASIGGVIWPVMLQRLLEHHNVSFAWSMRAIGFTLAPLLAIVCVTVVEPPSLCSTTSTALSVDSPSELEGKDRKEGEREEKAVAVATTTATAATMRRASRVDFSVWKNPTYILLCAGLAIAFLGWFIPVFYISAYAISQGQSPSVAFYLVSALNAASCFGRVVPGYLADRYGHYNFLTTLTILSGIIGFCWTKATTLIELVIWTLAYGFSSGAVISLQTACAGKITSPQSQGTAVGFLMACLSVSALIGAPISGQILNHSGYLALSIWTGVTLVSGGLAVGVARFSQNPGWRVPF